MKSRITNMQEEGQLVYHIMSSGFAMVPPICSSQSKVK